MTAGPVTHGETGGGAALPPMLAVRELQSPLFGPVDLAVPPGGCIAVTGPSGAGKSLLLRAIADLDPTEGAVCLDGVRRETMPAWQWRRRVAYVPAETGWWADRVGEHFGDTGGETAAAMVAALGLPEDVFAWTVDRLSSGERHRLGLVRALALRPRVLLLDEPTAALDETGTGRVEALIARHLADGGGAVVVTHDPGQAVRLGAVSMTMADGRLTAGRT